MYLILAEAELGARRAMATANGVLVIDDPLLQSGCYIVVPGNHGQPKSIIVQTYVARSKPST